MPANTDKEFNPLLDEVFDPEKHKSTLTLSQKVIRRPDNISEVKNEDEILNPEKHIPSLSADRKVIERPRNSSEATHKGEIFNPEKYRPSLSAGEIVSDSLKVLNPVDIEVTSPVPISRQTSIGSTEYYTPRSFSSPVPVQRAVSDPDLYHTASDGTNSAFRKVRREIEAKLEDTNISEEKREKFTKQVKSIKDLIKSKKQGNKTNSREKRITR